VGPGFSAVAVLGNRLVTMGYEGRPRQQEVIVCLDADTGKTQWKYTYECRHAIVPFPGPRATPTVDGTAVYTLSQQGELFCLDLISGKRRWSTDFKKEIDLQPITYGHACSPLVDGDQVIVDIGAEKASVVAVRKDTGAIVWKSLVGLRNGRSKGSYSSPVAVQLDGRQAILVFTAAGLAALDPKDGMSLWTYPWDSGIEVNTATPVAEGDLVFISSSGIRGCTLLRMAGNQASRIWQNKELRNHWSTSVRWKGHLYGYDGRENFSRSGLVCLDAKTGEVKWRETTKMAGSLICAGGKLICLRFDGELSVVEAVPDGYRRLARHQLFTIDPKRFKPVPQEPGIVISPDVCRTPPVLGNGRLYCRNARGDLVCLDLRKR
jgi:outer membrane protein assembly factor BamB